MPRARFQLTGYEAHSSNRPTTMEGGTPNPEATEPVELRTLYFTPVAVQNPENLATWGGALPEGRLALQNVPPETWAQFEIHREYVLDFALQPAPAAQA